MKIGILTCEGLYCNFTNYGTVLQAWALSKAISGVGGQYEPVLINYCPASMADKDPLNPMQHMWDTDAAAREMCELSLPAIRENFDKIRKFYFERFQMSDRSYTAENMETIVNEGIFRFICGSDSIWDIQEFGMDRAFFADFPVLRKSSIAYAPSFQDTFLAYAGQDGKLLAKYLENFIAIGIRDEEPLTYIKKHVKVPAKRVADPTLLLRADDYNEIIAPKQEYGKYLFYYSRRYNRQMEEFAERVAKERHLEIIEISLRAINSKRHRMFYEAGVEEFLSLVKHAECVVTNSFHCIIFALQFEKDFYAFARENCYKKIYELLNRFRLTERFFQTGGEKKDYKIDYSKVREIIEQERMESFAFLEKQLQLLIPLKVKEE